MPIWATHSSRAALAPGLLESAKLPGGGFFATITRLDGAFGLGGGAIRDPLQGGLAGLAKTAAAEWPEVRVHALDVSLQWEDAHAAARVIVAQLERPTGRSRSG